MYAVLSVCCFFAVAVLEHADYSRAQSNWICVFTVAGVVFGARALLALRPRHTKEP